MARRNDDPPDEPDYLVPCPDCLGIGTTIGRKTCQTCDGLGEVQELAFFQDDDGQPTEQEEWHDFDPDC